jgi:hypothetical protein
MPAVGMGKVWKSEAPDVHRLTDDACQALSGAHRPYGARNLPPGTQLPEKVYSRSASHRKPPTPRPSWTRSSAPWSTSSATPTRADAARLAPAHTRTLAHPRSRHHRRHHRRRRPPQRRGSRRIRVRPTKTPRPRPSPYPSRSKLRRQRRGRGGGPVGRVVDTMRPADQPDEVPAPDAVPPTEVVAAGGGSAGGNVARTALTDQQQCRGGGQKVQTNTLPDCPGVGASLPDRLDGPHVTLGRLTSTWL